jgi:PhoH-like ATPase
MGKDKRLYVLDTNVLMHDPASMFRFEEHDVFLPMIVLEELDAAKKGLTEVSRNVRQVSRFIGEMMNSRMGSSCLLHVAACFSRRAHPKPTPAC